MPGNFMRDLSLAVGLDGCAVGCGRWLVSFTCGWDLCACPLSIISHVFECLTYLWMPLGLSGWCALDYPEFWRVRDLVNLARGFSVFPCPVGVSLRCGCGSIFSYCLLNFPAIVGFYARANGSPLGSATWLAGVCPARACYSLYI